MSEPALALPTSFEPESLLGLVLDGRYALGAHLATGGMGAVFQARHVHLRKDVAVKVLRPELSSAPDLVERFRREAEIASALEHENIVRVTDFGRSEHGYLFLVMELLSGESLFDRLRRTGSLAPEEAVSILWQVCSGLEAAHALGVVHRDLKPENVFLARTASGREVTKILDFGICKIADPASGSATQAGIIVGTPEYLSPEQATGAAVDARADLYTVGLIAWRMLAGRHPYKAEDPRSLLMMQATRPVPPLAEALPAITAWPALAAAVARACEKDPALRPPTAGALRDALAAALGTAFLVPAGATPAPPLLSTPPDAQAPPPPPPLPAALPADRTTLPLPAARRARWSLAGALGRARAAAGAGAPLARARAAGAAGARRALAAARVHPALAATLALALVAALAAGLGTFAALTRPAADARARIAAGEVAEALAGIEAALADRPGDPALLLLRARALHRSRGRAGDALEAYQAALRAGPLDAEGLADLAASLGRERSLADRAARVLRDAGAAAIPAVRAAASDASGLHRLRALTLLRDLGAEEQVDRPALYGDLLADGDCDLRRAAASRLGEIGDPAALRALRKAAQASTERRGLFGSRSREPACGSAEASEAIRRIEAAR